ncbi:TlpA family protein disulfide reductase [Pseudarthrobacter chlorophenolicus]|uniref:TlpA family protein disulfide reductase n=1 Tax=Pseudarthrobacter chlorophenolicus TaxID=85085 RepID=UPI001C0B031A|nr:thioredoxin family protein [Pseudarthrobacter chlorophenolicus]
MLVLLLVIGASSTLFMSFQSSTGTSQGPDTGAAAAAPVGGAFTARTAQGKEVPVPGQKPSVLFFFNIECGACGPSTRTLAELQRRSPADANYIAVDIAPYETTRQIEDFLALNEASSLAYASDLNTQLITAYQITQVSTFVVLDDGGREVFRAVEPSEEQLKAALATAGGNPGA